MKMWIDFFHDTLKYSPVKSVIEKIVRILNRKNIENFSKVTEFVLYNELENMFRTHSDLMYTVQLHLGGFFKSHVLKEKMF